jgi:hypothetical protein
MENRGSKYITILVFEVDNRKKPYNDPLESTVPWRHLMLAAFAP